MLKSLSVVVLLLASVSATHATEISARVVDEQGTAVDDFEAMWHTSANGYSLWKRGQNGAWNASIGPVEGVVDLIVRAPGFASQVQRFEGKPLRTLYSGTASVVLERGTSVIIETQNLASPIPEDFLMESFFTQFGGQVRMMWQPVNVREKKKPDWNMLNVRKVDGSHLEVRVAKNSGEFFLAFQHPGWLRFCEFGPFHSDEVIVEGIPLQMPVPSRIRVTFDPRRMEKDRPFQSANCCVFWMPDGIGAMYSVTDGGVAFDENNAVAISDLGPGKYWVAVQTMPKDETTSIAGGEIDSGRFSDRERITVESGRSTDVAFAWAPFNPQAYRGTANSEISVKNGDGSVPTGRTIEVTWFDGHYGMLPVYKGPLPRSGIVRLDGVSTARHGNYPPFGQYKITIEGEQLGFFDLQETEKLQHLSFSVSPKPGDIAPDIELIAVGSLEHRKLSDHRGKVVLLEFWSTSCGPCQPAMQKLSDLAGHLPARWVDKVVLLSLSTDHDLQKLRTHIAARGWDGMPHFQAIRKDGEYFSDAEKAYVIHSIPHAILIDQQGTVRWRGHPTETTEGKTVNDRIGDLLK